MIVITRGQAQRKYNQKQAESKGDLHAAHDFGLDSWLQPQLRRSQRLAPPHMLRLSSLYQPYLKNFPNFAPDLTPPFPGDVDVAMQKQLEGAATVC